MHENKEGEHFTKDEDIEVLRKSDETVSVQFKKTGDSKEDSSDISE